MRREPRSPVWSLITKLWRFSVIVVLVGDASMSSGQTETKADPEAKEAGVAFEAAGEQYVPKRINKCIELLEAGQPIYYINGSGGYADGKALAKTWADYIWYDMEHAPFDVTRLREFMRGLVDGGPTPSGHRTPAVIVTLPVLGVDAETMKGGSWMVQQVLACGVHGLHLCRARDPDAVRLFVQSARYPFQKQAIDEVGEGLRGFGSHKFAAEIWGTDPEEYLRVADVWPLNPKGEIMLGIKIEDRHALARAEETVNVPGIAFAEWGPRDMGLSYGLLSGRADPPLPKVLQDAGDRVLTACQAADVFFLDNVLPENVAQRIDEGVMIGAGRLRESAEVGRRYTKRKMPW
jgi:4-hydroxy-2-oxoheptanedioate aldolase